MREKSYIPDFKWPDYKQQTFFIDCRAPILKDSRPMHLIGLITNSQPEES